MIVPMKKYSFLVFYKEYEPFLHKLQELGVAHIVEKQSGELEDESLVEKYSQIPQLNTTIDFLKKRKVEKANNTEKKDGLEVLSEINSLRETKENCLQQIDTLKKEYKIIEPWGEFNWGELEKLEKGNIKPRFFICPVKQFKKDWTFQHYIEKINELTGNIYFLLFDKKEENTELEADEIKLPKRSLSEIDKKITELNKEMATIESNLDEYASKYIHNLENTKQELLSHLSFDQVVLNTQKEAEDKLMILEGWVPKDKIEHTNQFLNNENMYYEVSDPTQEEKIPIKLKNNRFAKLFEMIGDLYSRPNYSEMDLTPFFAPFYWLFFGFCLGDAGYGLILAIAGLTMTFIGSKKMKNTFTLVFLLGLSTILFGIIGGTFFGINLYEIKFGFYAGLAEKFDAQKKTINDYLFYMAIALGAVQIIFGMFIKAANEMRMFGWKYSLGTLGWIIIVLGNGSLFGLFKVGMIETMPTGLLIATNILGFIGAFLLNNPDRNILINFGSGFWDAYNMATGLMGDLLSYIRLFALGISSSILGYVFNNLAISFAPQGIVGKILVIGIILAIGHGINIFMASLGAFVHPVRLTFVEFYKNAGFKGGGIKYSPFNKKKNN